ncbi:MAG: hypothetical protein M0C28_03845 [Candidatus Moduliflexus flocculans]|nr:hypothetical protein [Candidatus Moduliflexus flocculans]
MEESDAPEPVDRRGRPGRARALSAGQGRGPRPRGGLSPEEAFQEAEAEFQKAGSARRRLRPGPHRPSRPPLSPGRQVRFAPGLLRSNVRHRPAAAAAPEGVFPRSTSGAGSGPDGLPTRLPLGPGRGSVTTASMKGRPPSPRSTTRSTARRRRDNGPHGLLLPLGRPRSRPSARRSSRPPGSRSRRGLSHPGRGPDVHYRRHSPGRSRPCSRSSPSPSSEATPRRPWPTSSPSFSRSARPASISATGDPVGRTLRVNGEFDVRVSAVIRDVPAQSSLRFDAVVPFALQFAPSFAGAGPLGRQPPRDLGPPLPRRRPAVRRKEDHGHRRPAFRRGGRRGSNSASSRSSGNGCHAPGRTESLIRIDPPVLRGGPVRPRPGLRQLHQPQHGQGGGPGPRRSASARPWAPGRPTSSGSSWANRSGRPSWPSQRPLLLVALLLPAFNRIAGKALWPSAPSSKPSSHRSAFLAITLLRRASGRGLSGFGPVIVPGQDRPGRPRRKRALATRPGCARASSSSSSPCRSSSSWARRSSAASSPSSNPRTWASTAAAWSSCAWDRPSTAGFEGFKADLLGRPGIVGVTAGMQNPVNIGSTVFGSALDWPGKDPAVERHIPLGLRRLRLLRDAEDVVRRRTAVLPGLPRRRPGRLRRQRSRGAAHGPRRPGRTEDAGLQAGGDDRRRGQGLPLPAFARRHPADRLRAAALGPVLGLHPDRTGDRRPRRSAPSRTPSGGIRSGHRAPAGLLRRHDGPEPVLRRSRGSGRSRTTSRSRRSSSPASASSAWPRS